MRAALAAVVLAALAACAGETVERPYAKNDLELITAYTAKEMCSCLFVMQQTREYCTAWTRADPAVADFVVNEKKKVVKSSALFLWSGRARFVDARSGCVLE